jgi:hypothetical protein
MKLFEKVDSVAHYNYQDSNGGPFKFCKKFRGSCWGPTKGNPLRKLHESINKRQDSLILITLENIEYHTGD